MKVKLTKMWGAVLALVAAIPLIATVACTSLAPALQERIVQSQKASTRAAAQIDTAQAAIDALPATDPNRAELQKELTRVVALKVKADATIASAQAALNSLTTGAPLDQGTAGLLGALPYGAYLVTGISLFAFWQKRQQAAAATSDLGTVVTSLDQVGLSQTLSPNQKAVVATLQGPALAAKVDAIKAVGPGPVFVPGAGQIPMTAENAARNGTDTSVVSVDEAIPE